MGRVGQLPCLESDSGYLGRLGREEVLGTSASGLSWSLKSEDKFSILDLKYGSRLKKGFSGKVIHKSEESR